MGKVTLHLENKGRGAFKIEEDGKAVGEMVIGISDTALTIYHTEVDPEMEGKGLAREMLNEMVQYARDHHLQVVPLCAYVHVHFKRHPDEYSDIWLN